MIKCNWENQGRNSALSLGREWKTALIGNEILCVLFYVASIVRLELNDVQAYS